MAGVLEPSPTETCPPSSLPHDDRIARVRPSRQDDSPGLDRLRRAQELAALASCRRETLERTRAGYQRRLHAASDDFEATEGLRVVELALSLVPRPAGPWTAQGREGTRTETIVEPEKEPVNGSRIVGADWRARWFVHGSAWRRAPTRRRNAGRRIPHRP